MSTFSTQAQFGGFILLNEGEVLPSFVQGPNRPPPIVCGLGDENAQKMGRNVDVEEFAGSDDLLLKTRKPIDALDPKQIESFGFMLKRATIFRYLSDGDEYSSSFEYVRSSSGSESQTIWIHAARYPFKPIPMWQQEADAERGQLEVIRYTPETVENRQFLKLFTFHETFYHWFDGTTHFTLQARANIPNNEIESLLLLLKRFN